MSTASNGPVKTTCYMFYNKSFSKNIDARIHSAPYR